MAQFNLDGDMLHVCAWCDHLMDKDNKPLRLAPPEHRMMENVSHGLCTKCKVTIDRDNKLARQRETIYLGATA